VFFLNVLNVAIVFAKDEVSVQELPDAVIAYGFLASTYYEDFPNFLRSIEGSDPLRKIKRMHGSLHGLGSDVPSRIAFSHSSFILYGDATTQDYGFRDANEPYIGSLFVTTPLVLLDGKVLVIISSVAPQHTTIFLLDNTLKADLIYDSYKKHTFRNDGSMQEPMASIYQIRSLGNGRFLLKERKFPGAMGGGGGRILILDLPKLSVTVQRPKN
jgi:hypothetical protein